jgi:hypothetical protein
LRIGPYQGPVPTYTLSQVTSPAMLAHARRSSFRFSTGRTAWWRFSISTRTSRPLLMRPTPRTSSGLPRSCDPASCLASGP